MFRSRALDMEDFKTEVSIAPGAKVQFELHYQEVKWRKLGSYEHRVHLKPGRLAKHLEVSPPSSSWVPICAFRSSSLRGVPRHLTLQDRVVGGESALEEVGVPVPGGVTWWRSRQGLGR